jgi:hypothetical protein
MPYSPEALEEILNIVAKYNAMDDLPGDFNICSFTLGCYQPVLRQNIDTKMMQEHPEFYGEGLHPHPTIIGIWATWCNVDGGKYTFKAENFFAYLESK